MIARTPGGIDGNWEALPIVFGLAMDTITYLHRFAAKAVQTRRPGYERRIGAGPNYENGFAAMSATMRSRSAMSKRATTSTFLS
jgi:hypothetical protein